MTIRQPLIHNEEIVLRPEFKGFTYGEEEHVQNYKDAHQALKDFDKLSPAEKNAYLEE